MKTPLEVAKKKARALQRAFPAHFTLSQAQEALARLLDLPDWHHLAERASGGDQVLPTKRLKPADPAYVPTLHKYISRLADDRDVPPSEAHAFLLGWGVITVPLTDPYEREYEFWNASLSQAPDPEWGDHKEWLEEYGVERIADGIVQACPNYKHSYWFLSPQRLKAMPVALRGRLTVFHADDFWPHVVLAFPAEFSAGKVSDAWEAMRAQHPGVFELLQGRSAEDPYLQGFGPLAVRELSIQHPDAWLPLAFRWRAIPYRTVRSPGTPDRVYPCLRGRAMQAFIESKGHLKLADVQWFSLKDGEPMSMSRFEWGGLRPLQTGELVRETPQYASPFKHGPFFWLEYHSDEGGDLGLGYFPETDDCPENT